MEAHNGKCIIRYILHHKLKRAAGSPFGSSIQSWVTYLRYTHAISYERLSSICASVFGLKISEGAIANLLEKVKTSLDDLCNSNTPSVAAGKINLFR
ncbi:IS66 family transposase [Microcoleus sp. MON1_C1]|uniref:IS66 family transposase n=1 Tax=Microcoleus sp. MON1_C1 TaxID=2818827 RepID=UPI00404094F5